MTYVIGTLLIIFFVFAFQGLLSFPFWLLGFFVKIVFYPIELINQVIYPVSSLPYIIVLGFITFLMFKLIINYFKHKG